MGMLSDILGKLGIGKANAEPTTKTTNINPPPTSKTNPSSASANRPGSSGQAEPGSPSQAAPPDRSIPVVDVVSQLEKRAAANPQKLNWRTSIVDLLKLLDIDSSLQARKELAKELNCPPDLMEDSARMNVWLHKAVLARVAANGGNVPKELTD
jgi:hypothetical protein